MLLAEVSAVAVVRDAVAMVAAALSPIAVVRLPAVRAMFLPCTLLDMLLLLRPLGLLIALPLSLLGGMLVLP